MNPSPTRRLARFRRSLVVAGALGLVAAGAIGVFAPAALLPAYRFAAFACLAPALGSLLFLLIFQLTGGKWGVALAPFLAAGSRLAPWVWIFVLPLLFFFRPPASPWTDYGSVTMLGLRGAVCAAVLLGLAALLARRGARPPAWLGPVGLIVLVFTLHVAADDWLGALDPRWHSTAFPLVWMTGLAVAGLACAVLVALACGLSARTLGLDWGNLLLAALVFWCYVAFAQFLIIWAGNLPAEISWYERRTRGGWMLVPPLLAVLHFVLPFAVLLSRSFKRSPRMLGGVAATLLLAQLLYAAWLILPAFSADGPLVLLAALALLVAGGSLFLHRYLAAAQERLASP